MAGGRRIAGIVDREPDVGVAPPHTLPPHTFYYHADHLGSTAMVTAGDGALVNHSTYYPYGGLHTDYSNDAFAGFTSDYKYTDKEADDEIGLVYFGARYYWPELGRWISPDPLAIGGSMEATGRSHNAYTFVLGNPYLLIDPSGLRGVPGTEIDGLFLETIDESPAQIAAWMDIVGDQQRAARLKTGAAVAGLFGVTAVVGAAIGVTAAVGPAAVGSFLLEEGAEAALEEATGIPVIIDPVDLLEAGLKKGAREAAKETVAEVVEHAPRVTGPGTGVGPGAALRRAAGNLKNLTKGRIKQLGFDAEAVKSEIVVGAGGRFNIAVEQGGERIFLTPVKKGAGPPIDTGFTTHRP
jgi:RHS repeat-associated protein